MRFLFVPLIFLASLLHSDPANADPGKRRTKEERKTARAERQLSRMTSNSYDRTPEQRRKERQVMIVAIIGAGIILNVISRQEQ